MEEPDFAVVTAGQLLLSQLVEHDRRTTWDLVNEIDDLETARDVMITLLIMTDKILEPNDTMRRQAIDRIVASYPSDSQDAAGSAEAPRGGG